MLDRDTWNAHVAEYAPLFGGFLQLWEWGSVQELLGAPVRRVFVQQGQDTFLAQGIFHALPIAPYWFFPKGPLGNVDAQTAYALLREHFSPAAFVKIEPAFSVARSISSLHRHPTHTTIVDLTQSEDALFTAMKPKTRYNIRLAQKKGVEIVRADISALPRFLRLMEETAARDGFAPHPPERYRAILEGFQGKDVSAFLAIATYRGQDVAANIMVDALGVRTYLHGASSSVFREVMAPYALAAWLFADARARGLRAYDFWGVAPLDASAHHPWAGITRFKMGFGGAYVSALGTFDVPFSFLPYACYRGYRLLRRS